MHTDEAGYATDAIQRLIWLTSAGRHRGDLTPAQWAVLRFFQRANNCSRTLKAFTDYHGKTCASASQTVNGLVERGLLARQTSNRDRRKAHFDLTEKGRSILEQDPLNELIAAIDELPVDRKTVLGSIAQNLMAHICDARGKPGFGTCSSCAFLKEAFDNNGNGSAYYCSREQVDITASDLHKLCMKHSLRNSASEPGRQPVS